MLKDHGKVTRLNRREVLSSLVLVACASCSFSTSDGGFQAASGSSDSAEPGTPEAELYQRSKDLQRPMIDASRFGILGVSGQYVVGGPSGLGVGVGTIGGILPVIVVTASYEDRLEELPDDAARREQMLSDVRLTNQEADLAISSMNTVIERQETRVAEAKAAESPTQLQEANSEADAILAAMEEAKSGIESRKNEIARPMRRYAPPEMAPVLNQEFQRLDRKKEQVEDIIVTTRNSSLFRPT